MYDISKNQLKREYNRECLNQMTQSYQLLIQAMALYYDSIYISCSFKTLYSNEIRLIQRNVLN